jgi:hypothetical protein
VAFRRKCDLQHGQLRCRLSPGGKGPVVDIGRIAVRQHGARLRTDSFVARISMSGPSGLEGTGLI